MIFEIGRTALTRYFRAHCWPYIGLLLIFVLAMRLRGFLPTVIDWDESLYALVARELLEGRLPYVSIFDVKPLGSFVAMALAMAALGQTVFAIRVLGLLCVATTCLLLYAIARSGGLSRLSALAAGIFYANLTTTMGGLASNIEILYAPFVTATALVALRADGQHKPGRQMGTALGMGFLVGLGMWFKYLAILPGGALIAMLLFVWWIRGARLIHLGWSGVAFLVAAAWPTVVSGGYYAWLGYWAAFWHANFGFMSAYAALGVSDFSESIVLAGLTVLPVVLIAAFGIPSWPARRFHVGGLLLWLVAEGVAVSAPGKFYGHYFILMFPPICLLGAFGLDRVTTQIGRFNLSWLPGTLLVVACLPHMLYGTARVAWPLPDGTREIARVIRAEHRVGDMLWVVNSEPVIYLLTGLPVPTVYPFPPHLLGRFAAIIPDNPDLEISRLIGSRPRFVVIDPAKWAGANPVRRERIEAMLMAGYRQVGTFPFWDGPLLLYKSQD